MLVTRTADGGPAASAGVNPGDLIIGVDGKRVGGLADFLTKVWARGHAGVAIPLDILPHGAEDLNVRRIDVRSGDRYDWLKLIAP